MPSMPSYGEKEMFAKCTIQEMYILQYSTNFFGYLFFTSFFICIRFLMNDSIMNDSNYKIGYSFSQLNHWTDDTHAGFKHYYQILVQCVFLLVNRFNFQKFYHPENCWD